MTLDSEEHRAFLLHLLSVVEIPGRHIDLAYSVKQALISAPAQEAKPEIDHSRVSD